MPAAMADMFTTLVAISAAIAVSCLGQGHVQFSLDVCQSLRRLCLVDLY